MVLCLFKMFSIQLLQHSMSLTSVHHTIYLIYTLIYTIFNLAFFKYTFFSIFLFNSCARVMFRYHSGVNPTSYLAPYKGWGQKVCSTSIDVRPPVKMPEVQSLLSFTLRIQQPNVTWSLQPVQEYLTLCFHQTQITNDEQLINLFIQWCSVFITANFLPTCEMCRFKRITIHSHCKMFTVGAL